MIYSTPAYLLLTLIFSFYSTLCWSFIPQHCNGCINDLIKKLSLHRAAALLYDYTPSNIITVRLVTWQVCLLDLIYTVYVHSSELSGHLPDVNTGLSKSF